MATTFEAFTVALKSFGCTDSNSINYDVNAEKDNGMCIDAAFTECIENAILNISAKDCELESTRQYIEIYSYYKSLEAALKEKNNHKIDMYKDKLAKLCNVKRCESC